MRQKRIAITLNAEKYEALRKIIKELDWPDRWFSLQVDLLLDGLLQVAELARKDAEEQKEMTEAEAKKRYEDVMRKVMEPK